MLPNRYWPGLDRSINPMGMGCWQLAGKHSVNGKPNGWGEMSESKAIALVHKALDHGIEFFDTASGYGNGRSEELLGKAFRSNNSPTQPVVCSKIQLSHDEVVGHNSDLPYKIEASLQRLNVERIDVLLIHSPPDTIDWNQFDRSILDQLELEGKIGTYGISSKSITGAINAAKSNFGTVVEWVFGLLERRPVDMLFPILETAKMNFIARSPLSRGLFSPLHLSQVPHFASTDFRSTLDQDWMHWTLDSIRNMQMTEFELATLSNHALAYCLNYEETSVVIPGINKPRHLSSYLELPTHVPLSTDFIKKIQDSTEEFYPKW